MRNSKHLFRIFAAIALLIAVAGSADARTRKGDKLIKAGRAAEERKEWDKALDLYEQAMSEDPRDTSYQIPMRRVRFQAGQAHVDLGLKLRKDGKLDEALAEFQKAYAIDPSSAIAEQELKRTLATIERNSKTQLKPEDQRLTPSELARKNELERVARIQEPPELKPLSRQAINLRMSNQPPRVLYETVGKLAGVNVVFDADFKQDQNASRTLSVELNNSTLEDALNYLATMTKTFWKPLSTNAIFVTTDNQAKRREYQDYAVKVFYLSNVTTPQELTEIATTFRTVAEIRKLFQVNSLNAIIVKGTPDEIALATKLMNDLDKPRAEVVVDVVVMEANRAKTRSLAATIASAGTAGLNTAIQFTPRNPVLLGGTDKPTTPTTDPITGVPNTPITTPTTPTQQLISLARIGRISTNDFSVTLPGALLNFVMSDRSTRVLQSPQVRAASGQKASLRIGDKVPVAQGGFQPFGGGAGGVGGYNSLYSQFQFIDVGVNVDITPTVHGDGDVTLKVMFEISNVRDRVDIGGISQPVIGQRKVEHEIRIHEGEASLLGGLMQDQDTKAISGIPGLASIPILRRLFSSESIEKNESELLIALIPHIVRTPGVTDVNMRAIAAGSDTVVKLNWMARPDGTVVPAVTTEPASPAGAPPATAQPPVALPGVLPIPATQAPEAQPPATAPGQPAAPPSQSQGTPVVPQTAAPETSAVGRFLFRPITATVQPGNTFTLELLAENVQDLAAAPFHLKFDPQLVRLQEVRPGPMLSADGQQVVFTRNILNDTGDVTVNLNRRPDAGGVSGSGVLATFTFQAVAPGTANILFSQFGPRNAQLAEIKADPPRAAVVVKQ
ncbi:MAG TPA: cohesin domain-containing protein [Bryobacteraceae bacterium]|nr:cohesin domain-containing protein [Bryobacteraceae bacterium]